MILITGATGFVGRHVVRALTERGLPVKGLARRGAPLPAGTPLLLGDVTKPETLDFAGVQAVVHLVAIRRQWRERTFDRVTAQGTVNVLAAAKAAGVSRFIYVSALGLTPEPKTDYMRAKAAAEQAVKESGLAYTILRPSFIIGPGGFVEEYGTLGRRAPAVPIPGTGQYPVMPISGQAVARAVYEALTREEAVGKTYDLCGSERVSFEAFIDLIMQATGTKKPKVRVPLWLMRPMAWCLERLTPNPPATTDELALLVAGNVGNPGPAEAELGLEPEPLAKAIEAAVAEWLK